MRSIKMLGLGVVAVLALAVSASAASAHEFEYTGGLPGSLSGSALTKQVFTAGIGTVECSTLTAEGPIEKAKATLQEATIDYSKCEAEPLSGVAEPIVANYLFDANAGTVFVMKAIKFTIGGGVCTITIPTQELPNAVTYENVGSELTISAKATNIRYEVSSSFFCGGGNGTTATYTGSSMAKSAEGAISWL